MALYLPAADCARGRILMVSPAYCWNLTSIGVVLFGAPLVGGRGARGKSRFGDLSACVFAAGGHGYGTKHRPASGANFCGSDAPNDVARA
jgi:hypothetical protein